MRLFVAASLLAMLTLPATARIGSLSGVDFQARRGVPASNTANIQDTKFAQLMAEDSLAKVVLGKMANAKAQRNEVKQFARRVVQDHSKIGGELKRLAKHTNISLSHNLEPVDVVVKQQLDRLSGGAFDMAYVRDQLFAHKKAIIMLKYELTEGKNSAIQKLAAESLPIVIAHLRMARELMDELTGAATTAMVRTRAPPTAPI
jgi:putative membrane protein